MATIDEELGQLERDIRQLKIEYDQYFGGGRKRPPTEIEWRIDQLVKRYAERGGELKFHQRFRFNNLSQTYAKYKDIFRKKVALKEEGKIQRHFGAAAKEIEAARAKKEAEDMQPRLGPVSPRHFASRVPSRSVKRRRSSSCTRRSCRPSRRRRRDEKAVALQLHRICVEKNERTAKTEELPRRRIRRGSSRRQVKLKALVKS